MCSAYLSAVMIESSSGPDPTRPEPYSSTAASRGGSAGDSGPVPGVGQGSSSPATTHHRPYRQCTAPLLIVEKRRCVHELERHDA